MLRILIFTFLQGRKRHRETPDEKEKKHEQDKIRYEMKQREQKRLRMAQSIQRELEEVEVKQAALEQEGIKTEKALRGGTCEYKAGVEQNWACRTITYFISVSLFLK